MRCPNCLAKIRDDAYTCPKCNTYVRGLQDGPNDLKEPVEKKKYQTSLNKVVTNYNPLADEDEVDVRPDRQPVSLMDSVMRPLKGDESIKKILIGSFLFLIPVAGQILGTGFGYEYIRRLINPKEQDKLPEWDNWAEILKNGIILTIISLIYIGAAVLVTSPLVFLGGLLNVFGLTSKAVIPILMPNLVILISVFFVPMAHILCVRYNDFRAAFDFRLILRLVTTDFKGFVATAFACFLFGGVVATVIAIVNTQPFKYLSYFIGGAYFIVMLVWQSAMSEYFLRNCEKAEV